MLITNVQVALVDYVRWFQSSLLARRVVRLYWLDPAIGSVESTAELALVFINTMVTKTDDGYMLNCHQTSLGELNGSQQGICEGERIGAVRIQCTPRKLEIEIAVGRNIVSSACMCAWHFVSGAGSKLWRSECLVDFAVEMNSQRDGHHCLGQWKMAEWQSDGADTSCTQHTWSTDSNWQP